MSRFGLYTLLEVWFVFVWTLYKSLVILCSYVWPYATTLFGRDSCFPCFASVDKRILFFVCMLCFLKYWYLISSKKGQSCLLLCFLTTDISSDDQINYWVKYQRGYKKFFPCVCKDKYGLFWTWSPKNCFGMWIAFWICFEFAKYLLNYNFG